MYILPLNSPEATLERVGGKGANLGRMVRAGLPVPDGFLITTAAYQAFLEANQLEGFIGKTLETISPEDPQALEEASGAIRACRAGPQRAVRAHVHRAPPRAAPPRPR